MGRNYDSLFDKQKRTCRFVEADRFGDKIGHGSNETFNGGLGLLQSKKGDLFLYEATQHFKKEPFFEHSHPSYSQRFLS